MGASKDELGTPNRKADIIRIMVQTGKVIKAKSPQKTIAQFTYK